MAEKKKEEAAKPAEVKAAERVVSNIPAKLKESFSSGTAARAVTKAWAAKAGKIATWTTVILMALVLVFDTIPYYMEGGSAPKVSSSSQQQAPTTQTPPVNAAREYFGGHVTVPASSEWSSWVKGSSDRCVWIFDVKPEQVQVKIKESDKPLDWNDYQTKKQKGEVGDFGFFRTRSDGTMTKITYEFRPRGMCS